MRRFFTYTAEPGGARRVFYIYSRAGVARVGYFTYTAEPGGARRVFYIYSQAGCARVGNFKYRVSSYNQT